MTQGNNEFAVSILGTLLSKDEMKSWKMSWGCYHFVQQRPGRTATLHHHILKHFSHRVPAQHILYRCKLTTCDMNSHFTDTGCRLALVLLLIHLRGLRD